MNSPVEKSPREVLPLLAIELSQRAGGAAVRAVDGATHTRAFEGGRRDRDDVLPGIESALNDSGVRASSLAAVAVDVGPGGFTGLRISIAAGHRGSRVCRGHRGSGGARCGRVDSQFGDEDRRGHRVLRRERWDRLVLAGDPCFG